MRAASRRKVLRWGSLGVLAGLSGCVGTLSEQFAYQEPGALVVQNIAAEPRDLTVLVRPAGRDDADPVARADLTVPPGEYAVRENFVNRGGRYEVVGRWSGGRDSIRYSPGDGASGFQGGSIVAELTASALHLEVASPSAFV